MATKRAWAYVTAFVLVLASLLSVTLVFAAPGFQPEARPVASTLTVTTTADTVSCAIPCSLRGAILAANSGDTIVIPAGVYTLTLGSELTVDKSLTLTGDGADTTIIQVTVSSADATHRVLTTTGDNATVTISGVTVRHGKTSGSLPANAGGGIHNSAILTLIPS